MKILTILGARPQFIKAGSISREISKYQEIDEVIIHTGQHYDSNMSDIFFEEMKIPEPNYFLGIGGKSHGAMTGQMIEKIEEVVIKEKPDWIMVYGDINSTLAGAIVVSKLHIKLAHIEAGLRSFNMNMPEEINRILTDRVSSLLFCPTDSAVTNLKKEGFENFPVKIVKSGDVMQDGANFYRSLAKRPDIELNSDFILCTVHRAENTDSKDRLREIFEALEEIAQSKAVVLPLHLRTGSLIEKFGIKIEKINLIKPVGYLEMVWLIQNSRMLMTDSGGLQKEAFFFEKQCITLRDETEWVELVENGFNVLVGSKKEKILEAFKSHKFNTDFSINLYGNGKASDIIIKGILNAK